MKRSSSGRPGRIASLDALRGLTIFLMVLVNDVAQSADGPGWLNHMPPGVDGMTFADLVFPAFLFVAGMSAPLSITAARARGASTREIVRKVLWRTTSLLIMGTFMVGRTENTGWRPSLWTGLMYVCFFLTWSVLPEKDRPRTRRAFLAGRVIGVAGLVALAVVYRGPGGERLVLGPLFEGGGESWLRHEWWGILGIIGWSYLITSMAYLAGARRAALLGLTSLFISIYLAEEAGPTTALADRTWLDWLSPLSGGLSAAHGWLQTHLGLGPVVGVPTALSLAGAALGTLLLPDGETEPRERIRYALTLGAGLAIGAILLDPLHGISKPAGTPSWGLWCAAITSWTWAFTHWLMDVRGVTRWAAFLRPAGQNPLTAYILHPLVRGALVLIPGLELLRFYKHEGMGPYVATLGALAMTLGIVWLTGALGRRGFRLKV